MGARAGNRRSRILTAMVLPRTKNTQAASVWIKLKLQIMRCQGIVTGNCRKATICQKRASALSWTFSPASRKAKSRHQDRRRPSIDRSRMERFDRTVAVMRMRRAGALETTPTGPGTVHQSPIKESCANSIYHVTHVSRWTQDGAHVRGWRSSLL